MKRVSVLTIILLIGWGTAHAQSVQKSAPLKTLDARSLDLSEDLDRLHTRMNAIESALQHTGQLLTTPGLAYKQLVTLETSFSTADRMLQTAELPPQTRDKAKQLREQIAPALKKITAAKVKLGTIALKTDPLSEKLLRAAKRLRQADTVLVAFNAVALHPEPFATTLAQQCVDGAVERVRPCMQRKVDEKAGDIDKVVVELDRVVELLLTDVGTIEGILPSLAAINSMMEGLGEFQKLLGPMTASLEEFIAPLRKLDDLLGTNLKKCYEVPTSIWTTQRVCTPDISMRVIVQGVGKIMDEIESVVDGALLTALNWVGLDKIAQALIDLAQEPVNAVLRELKLDLNINLGDIDSVINIEVTLPGIDIDFDRLLPELDVNSPSLGFPGFASGLSVKSIDPSWFNPGNLKPGDIQVVPCRQGSFVCKDEGEECASKADASCNDGLICRKRGTRDYRCVTKRTSYQGDPCDAEDANAGSIECIDKLVCRNVGDGYFCVGRGSEGDLCSREEAGAGSQNCGGDLICRPKNDGRHYCVQKGSAHKNDRCLAADAGHGSIQCADDLTCRAAGTDEHDYRCMRIGDQNDYCARDDAGRGSNSCGGNLICRNTGFETYNCIGRGLEGDLCSEEEAAGRARPSCGRSLVCRVSPPTTQVDSVRLGAAFRCTRP